MHSTSDRTCNEENWVKDALIHLLQGLLLPYLVEFRTSFKGLLLFLGGLSPPPILSTLREVGLAAEKRVDAVHKTPGRLRSLILLRLLANPLGVVPG